jgi:hypothetical protein
MSMIALAAVRGCNVLGVSQPAGVRLLGIRPSTRLGSGVAPKVCQRPKKAVGAQRCREGWLASLSHGYCLLMALRPRGSLTIGFRLGYSGCPSFSRWLADGSF